MANLAMLLVLETYATNKVDVNGDMENEIMGVEQFESKVAMGRVDEPDVSGPIKNLPWSDDEQFFNAQDENNARILMAAYCAVLLDPLPGEEYNVRLAANSLSGTVVMPGEIFSQNQAIGPYTKGRGYRMGASYSGGNIIQTEGGGVCKIASTLYNGAILSNLEIVERHNHSMPVNYVPYGQDATVAYGAKDFKFKNNTDSPILIWARMVGHRLYIGFYGQETPPRIIWNHRVTDTVEAPIYYRTNSDLEQGQKKVIVKGIDGATVESTIDIEYEDGRVETKDLGISHYNPMPHVIEMKQRRN